MRPAICEGSGPVTRFSATALAEGWAKVTLCWLPTSKLLPVDRRPLARLIDPRVAGGAADRGTARHHGPTQSDARSVPAERWPGRR